MVAHFGGLDDGRNNSPAFIIGPEDLEGTALADSVAGIFPSSSYATTYLPAMKAAIQAAIDAANTPPADPPPPKDTGTGTGTGTGP